MRLEDANGVPEHSPRLPSEARLPWDTGHALATQTGLRNFSEK